MKRYNTQSQKKLKDKRSRLLGEFDKRVPFPERQVYTTTVYPKIERKPDFTKVHVNNKCLSFILLCFSFI